MKRTVFAVLALGAIAITTGAAQAQVQSPVAGLVAVPNIKDALTPAIDPCRLNLGGTQRRPCTTNQPQPRQPTQTRGPSQAGPKPEQRLPRRP